MPILRPSMRTEIINILDQSYFTSSAFDVDIPTSGGPAALIITFRLHKAWEFIISENPDPGGSPDGRYRYPDTEYITMEAPGAVTVDSQIYGYHDIGVAISVIPSWLKRVEEDFRSQNPVMDEFDRLRDEILAEVENHIADKDQHFSREEINALSEQLNQLKARMEEMALRVEVSEETLEKALTEIDQLKSDLESFPRGAWYKVAGTKLVTAMKRVAKTKEAREFVLEAAKKYLLPGS